MSVQQNAVWPKLFCTKEPNSKEMLNFVLVVFWEQIEDTNKNCNRIFKNTYYLFRKMEKQSGLQEIKYLGFVFI